MTMTDPIADMLTRLRNANTAYHDTVAMPHSKLKTHVAEILQQEGYISGWHVDEAIKSEEDRVVVIRFGHDWDSQCMTMDETLYSVAEKVQNFAVIYLVDITDVPDFNKVGGVLR